MGYLGNQITTVFPTSISVDSATISGNTTVGGTLGVTGVSTLSENIVFDASGKGVHLGVTSATASNLLDDYEEGTWTPAYGTSGTQFPSVTYAAQKGHYTKMGRLVIATCLLATNAVDKTGVSGGSNVRVTGLPFTPSNSTGSQMGIQLFPLGFNPNWTSNPQKINVTENATHMALQQDDYNAGQYNLAHYTTVDDVATGSNANYCYCQVMYNVS